MAKKYEFTVIGFYDNDTDDMQGYTGDIEIDKDDPDLAAALVAQRACHGFFVVSVIRGKHKEAFQSSRVMSREELLELFDLDDAASPSGV